MWQHVQLSEQIRPCDTLACCWDVKQPTNSNSLCYFLLPEKKPLAVPDICYYLSQGRYLTHCLTYATTCHRGGISLTFLVREESTDANRDRELGSLTHIPGQRRVNRDRELGSLTHIPGQRRVNRDRELGSLTHIPGQRRVNRDRELGSLTHIPGQRRVNRRQQRQGAR